MTCAEESYVHRCSSISKVDRINAKDRLLHITSELTCGVVNGRRTRIRPVIKPPWAEKKEDTHSELPLEEDMDGPASSSETNSVLSREQLKALRSQRGWPHFKDVFMLSSVDKEDVDTLKVVRMLECSLLWFGLSFTSCLLRLSRDILKYEVIISASPLIGQFIISL